jgi:integrative and conjugative element protein (TIGR02256 family)
VQHLFKKTLTPPARERLFHLPDAGLLLIEKSVLERIHANRQVGNQREAGGLLIGYFRDPHLHITDLTLPGAGDCRSRFRFARKDPSHLQLVQDCHTGSGRLLNLLGEWHTHPEAVPSPSGIDQCDWVKTLAVRASQPTVFLIAGTESDWIGHCSGRDRRVMPLSEL